MRLFRGSPSVVLANVQHCVIEVSESDRHSDDYLHFQTNTLGKGREPYYLESYGLNSTSTFISASMALVLNKQRQLISH